MSNLKNDMNKQEGDFGNIKYVGCDPEGETEEPLGDIKARNVIVKLIETFCQIKCGQK